jgi:hypothetical protein
VISACGGKKLTIFPKKSKIFPKTPATEQKKTANNKKMKIFLRY